MFNNKAQVQAVEHKPQETSPPIRIKDPEKEKQKQPLKQQNGTLNHNNNNHHFVQDDKDLEQIGKETQELRVKTRKLQLEIEEKNEIINVLKDELETTKEQSDKFQRENLQLLKDAKRVAFLQDENDFLQDKVGNVDKLEAEIKRLKEKLQELDFLKLRIGELEDDRTEAREESADFERKWQQADAQLKRVAELEAEINKWKSFSHELELERDSIQNKLLESIERENKLTLINKQVDDEICRLRTVIKSYEDQQDVEQASNSLIMSVADLQQLDAQSHFNLHKQQQQLVEQETQTIGDIIVEEDEETKKKRQSEEDARRLETAALARAKLELQEKLEKEIAEADSQRKQIIQLEGEINKCKTFSRELSKERDLMEDKLFVALDRENRLNSIKRSVDDEIIGLKKLVQTYKELAVENRSLKSKLKKADEEFNELKLTSREVRQELECDKKTISVLRQDLACEKNMALKLTNRLKGLEKQMKSMEKTYFPIHDQTISATSHSIAASATTASTIVTLTATKQPPVPSATSTTATTATTTLATSTTTTTTTNNGTITIQEPKLHQHGNNFTSIASSTKPLVNGSQHQQLQSSPEKSTTHLNNNFIRNSAATRSINQAQFCRLTQVRQQQQQQQQKELQQKQQHHQQNFMPSTIDTTKLSDQQLAHLMAHHEHYHHLHHVPCMHRLHQMHHHQTQNIAQVNGSGNGNVNGVGVAPAALTNQAWLSNLAAIKANDHFAFASLRAPKSATSIVRSQQQVSRAQITATSVDKRLQQINGSLVSGSSENNGNGAVKGESPKHKKPLDTNQSTAFISYGCV